MPCAHQIRELQLRASDKGVTLTLAHGSAWHVAPLLISSALQDVLIDASEVRVEGVAVGERIGDAGTLVVGEMIIRRER